MGFCGSNHPDWKAYKRKYNEEFFAKAADSDSGETYYVDTRWVVLYASQDQKIPVERVRDCLRMVNMVFGGTNEEDLAKVPNTQYNPWAPVVGNPRIQFLPLDADDLTVEYKQISGTLNSSTPVTDAASRAGVTDGVLNVYIGSSGSGSILGQAQLSSNIVFGLYSAIGGYTVPGTLVGYQMGKTIAHEIAHALSVVHVFTDTKCDGFSPFNDVPESITPNYNQQLVSINGTWDLIGDNRYRDRLNGTSISCLNFQADPANSPNDQSCNIMDYGDDEVSIMFSKDQATIMRTYLAGSDNSTLTLKSATDASISGGGRTTDAEAETSSGLTTTEITLIAVFCGLGLIALIAVAVYYGRKGKKMGSRAYGRPWTMKRSYQYI